MFLFLSVCYVDSVAVFWNEPYGTGCWDRSDRLCLRLDFDGPGDCGGPHVGPLFRQRRVGLGQHISVFLAALSVGYFFGGLLSRRYPHGLGLATAIALAALTLIPVAIWYPDVNDWLAGFDIHEQWASLLAAASLFCVPSVLLGMVSPMPCG